MICTDDVALVVGVCFSVHHNTTTFVCESRTDNSSLIVLIVSRTFGEFGAKSRNAARLPSWISSLLMISFTDMMFLLWN